MKWYQNYMLEKEFGCGQCGKEGELYMPCPTPSEESQLVSGWHVDHWVFCWDCALKINNFVSHEKIELLDDEALKNWLSDYDDDQLAGDILSQFPPGDFGWQ